MIQKIKEKIFNPWIQLICAIVLIACYWSWDILLSEHAGEYIAYEYTTEDTTRVIPSDSLQVIYPDTTGIPQQILERWEQERDMAMELPPDSDVYEEDNNVPEEINRRPSESSETPVEVDRTYKWVDMILGHLTSILGTLGTLAIPAYNFWSQRNKKEEE